ncbi:MAG: rhodanese-like domain-containing protein [Euryarchaeota archaeon]|nr:rhodanese-like domain-containing protein [Euryarchaeota archaeon]
MKKIIIVEIFLVIMSGCLTTTTNQYDEPRFYNINIYQAKESLDEKLEETILDVRSHDEYASGHLKDAMNIPLQDFNKTDVMKELDKIPKNNFILIYSNDSRSAQASQILIDRGFTLVYNMEDGITAWIDAGFEIVK